MNARRAGDGWWPTRQQELLLQAALLHGPRATAAWELWNAQVDVARLDPDAQRWLPQLYCALRSRGMSHPQMARFKGVYRRAWYENHLLFHTMAKVLRALELAGIRTVLLKGAALVAQYYRDYGLRSMEDLDVLVPADQVPSAIAVVRSLGFTPVWDERAEAEVLASRHAWDFKDAADRQLDLHWHVFHERIEPSPDIEFWDAASPLSIHGASTRTLNAADQLLLVCVHGTAWNPEPSVRWVADAMAILRAAPGGLDWDRLLAHAHRYRFTLLLRAMLAYLRDALDAPVPSHVLQQLNTAPVSRAERIAYTARTRSPRHWGPWLALCVAYLEYCSTASANTGVFRRVAGLPRYFQDRWRARSIWHVAVSAALRGVRRIGWVVATFARQRRGPRRRLAVGAPLGDTRHRQGSW